MIFRAVRRLTTGVCLLLAGLSAGAVIAPGALARTGTVGPSYLDEIGSQLLPIRGGSADAIGDARHDFVTVSEAGRVMVDVYVSAPADTAADSLRDVGMSVAATANTPVPVVEGWIPATALGRAAQLGITDAIVPVIGSGTDAGTVQSQGVAAHHIPQAIAAGAGGGTGIDVGVISDSINRAGGGVNASQLTGNLPTNTIVLKDGLPGDSDEGRAMSEIIFDEAPALNKITFASGTNVGAVDKADSINRLVASGADVIADDIFYMNEPMFQDGVVSQAVDAARAAGVAYFASAGNRARQSRPPIRIAVVSMTSAPAPLLTRFRPWRRSTTAGSSSSLSTGTSRSVP